MSTDLRVLRTVVAMLAETRHCEGCARDVPAHDLDPASVWCSTCRFVIPYVVYGERR